MGKNNTAQDYIRKIRTPHERQGYRDAGPETKGGTYHGAPKRWTGRGPAPARHIPWPEVGTRTVLEMLQLTKPS